MPSDSLEGVALVTGGGRGIGASIARELAEAGMRVAVTGRTPEQVSAVATEIGGIGVTGDVSNQDDVESWVEATEHQLGPIDRRKRHEHRPVRIAIIELFAHGDRQPRLADAAGAREGDQPDFGFLE